MSQENVDFVAGLYAATSEMDKEAILAALPDPKLTTARAPELPSWQLARS
jgi:hypothetical protein